MGIEVKSHGHGEWEDYMGRLRDGGKIIILQVGFVLNLLLVCFQFNIIIITTSMQAHMHTWNSLSTLSLRFGKPSFSCWADS